MTPEEFKELAQKLYDKHEGYGGEEGHMDKDSLMYKCLKSLGYQDGLNILNKLEPIWYS
jgi:hypothetical protein